MCKNWYLVFAYLAIATGCSTGGGFSVGNMIAQQPQPRRSQLASARKAPGMTERVTSTIKSVIPGMGDKPNASASALPSHDPISLGFKSGPPSAELYLSMAQLSDRQGDVAEARAMYLKALSIDPKHRDALLGLGRLEDREGRMQDALMVYQEAAALHPQDAKVLNDLALCLARTGQLPASAQVLNQASQLQPQKKLYRNNFAKVLIEMNRIDEAVGQLSAVYPPAVVQYNVGVLLNDRGRTDEAVRFLTAATHIDPQLQEASAMLTQIHSGGINSGENQMAQSPASPEDDGILPTPMVPTTQMVGQPYPSTNAPARPYFQAVPAETAQVPVGDAPVLLPAIR